MSHRSSSLVGIILLQCSLLMLFAPEASSQATATPQGSAANAAANQNLPEITSRDETTTFKVKVNLVEVRVVVRDAKGQAIGNLKQEEFELLDNGKPQTIAKFSEEKAGGANLLPKLPTPANPADASQPAASAAADIPNRFVAYLFDDVHARDADLAQARNALKPLLARIAPSERAAIFTTSGLAQLDFSDDRAKLAATLDRISAHPVGQPAVTPCPNISYYMADLIQNKQDQRAILMATQDAWDCAFLDDPNMYSQAKALAETTALQELDRHDAEVRLALSIIKEVIRRTAEMPGERTIVFVSPGFINPDELSSELESMERALHAKVVINTLDIRGLYTEVPDVSIERVPSPTIAGVVQQYDISEHQQDSEILADFADATGGTFFHNNNDLREGFQRLASPPEYSYVLAFTPQNLRLDGKFHKLKIVLRPPAKGTIQARKGYYAPKGPADATEQVRQDIEDAVFSREEVRDIPLEVHTQFFKPDQNDARLSVVARVDVRHIHFRKDNGRNNNDLTVVSAIFDGNGNFISGTQKILQLHLKDETLEGRLGSGLVLKSNFDVKPGNYVVRLVVRGEDGQLAAENSAVDIP
jgi:VWFA-related protein